MSFRHSDIIYRCSFLNVTLNLEKFMAETEKAFFSGRRSSENHCWPADHSSYETSLSPVYHIIHHILVLNRLWADAADGVLK